MADESSTAVIEPGFVNEIDVDNLPREVPQDKPPFEIKVGMPTVATRPGTQPKLSPDAIKR